MQEARHGAPQLSSGNGEATRGGGEKAAETCDFQPLATATHWSATNGPRVAVGAGGGG